MEISVESKKIFKMYTNELIYKTELGEKNLRLLSEGIAGGSREISYFGKNIYTLLCIK